AMRWYLYTASPPGQERRFSSDLVGEVLRNFTLTLWNTYSFFVTYANLDGWVPDSKITPEYSSLDRWVLSSLNTLIRDVTEALENYDVLGATRPIEGFVDQLSNWYLRRSRRRFWKSESDGDKFAAYATLYEALKTISMLLGPTMPFMAEAIYQNLVLSVDPQSSVSVHLEKWPEFKEDMIDESLNKEMALVMKLASVGHAARNRANRKVRQPLSEAAFSVGNIDERYIVIKYSDILEDELNVKKVRVLDAATEAVSYEVKPLPKQLGQKYGAKFPAIRSELTKLDHEITAKTLLENNPVVVVVEGFRFEILPEEVEVRAMAKEGYAVAAEGAYLAALVTELTPELEKEGLSREFVRRVQDLRKTADFDIADRIKLFYTATPKLNQAIKEHSEYIMGETLTIAIREELPPAYLTQINTDFDGENLIVGVEKI
ncbi:MAG: class I tRNA ligase family protein, partial [Anaerolineaceae bacterium]|nr:class I tRNA ligase family protein [Anaerolineaceae bacterium]